MSLELKDRTLQIPAKRYRIGELVRYTPFSRQTIHNYTIMGLIREVEWTEGGHRLYDESVFQTLSKIIELRTTKTLCEFNVLPWKGVVARSLNPGLVQPRQQHSCRVTLTRYSPGIG